MKILLMYSPGAHHFEALREAAPSAQLAVAESLASAAEQIKDADVVMGNRYFLQSLPYARNLSWMQSGSMGVDTILEGGGTAIRDLTITSCRGVYDSEIAEHALSLILAFYRGVHLARDYQRQGCWKRIPLRSLAGTRALILGWGGVGQRIAHYMRALNVRVQGVRRRHNGAPQKNSDGFLIWGADSWRDALPQTDILVLALPKTAQTHHLVSRPELNGLPRDALLVNVGRGGTLDETALHLTLDEGHLLGAALDVFEHEPLPEHHWIWTHEKILITPHWARSIETPPYRWEPLFVENLRRFYQGEVLLNVVDKCAGY